MRNIQDQFVDVVRTTEESMECVDLQELKAYATQLSVSTKYPYTKAVAGKLWAINDAQTTQKIFGILGMYWNFLDYGLLKRVVEKFGSLDCQKCMDKYVVKLNLFCSRVTVGDFSNHWRCDLPPCYSELKMNMRVQMGCSLESLQQLQINFSRQILNESRLQPVYHGRIQPSVLCLGLHSSFPIHELALSCQSNSHFLQLHGILKIEFKGTCIFSHRSPQAVSSFILHVYTLA